MWPGGLTTLRPIDCQYLFDNKNRTSDSGNVGLCLRGRPRLHRCIPVSDPASLIQGIKSALRGNQWFVVVHPTDADPLGHAEQLLKRDAFELMQPL